MIAEFKPRKFNNNLSILRDRWRPSRPINGSEFMLDRLKYF
tara:strand:- start:1 stop:123 length:123 start_codon:yes stop_codon:yes gene_type:complete